jgi:hypothetical protein
MAERGERLRLAGEAGEAIRVTREDLGKDFDCDVAVERGISRAVHLAHPAHADERLEYVRPQPRAGAQGHKVARGIRACVAARTVMRGAGLCHVHDRRAAVLRL